MTVYSDDFVNGVLEALNYGQQLRIRYFNEFNNGDYDSDITLTQSGADYWCSGVILPINQGRGSSDAIVLQQGRVLTNDTKIYIQGNINTSGVLRIGLGSPITGEYSILPDGVIKYSVNQIDVLKKIYLRLLPTGSLSGE
jgi:hypothetical protein